MLKVPLQHLSAILALREANSVEGEAVREHVVLHLCSVYSARFVFMYGSDALAYVYTCATGLNTFKPPRAYPSER